jgi:hypothetical protein
MSLNTKTISTMSIMNTKEKSICDLIAIGGEDGVGILELIVVEILAYDRSKASFECQSSMNIAERLVLGLTFIDSRRLAAVYNDFPALAFIILN